MSSSDDNNIDPFQRLAVSTAHLNSLRRRRWFAVPYYELMSGALIWPDETNQQTPVHTIWALRMLWAFRTSVMIEQPRDELKQYWDYGLATFPKWVGFRQERRVFTPKLLRIYRKGDVGMRKCLHDLKLTGADEA